MKIIRVLLPVLCIALFLSAQAPPTNALAAANTAALPIRLQNFLDAEYNPLAAGVDPVAYVVFSVRDDATGEPISGARIFASKTPTPTAPSWKRNYYTGANGSVHFTIDGGAGDYCVQSVLHDPYTGFYAPVSNIEPNKFCLTISDQDVYKSCAVRWTR